MVKVFLNFLTPGVGGRRYNNSRSLLYIAPVVSSGKRPSPWQNNIRSEWNYLNKVCHIRIYGKWWGLLWPANELDHKHILVLRVVRISGDGSRIPGKPFIWFRGVQIASHAHVQIISPMDSRIYPEKPGNVSTVLVTLTSLLLIEGGGRRRICLAFA